MGDIAAATESTRRPATDRYLSIGRRIKEPHDSRHRTSGRSFSTGTVREAA
jgi:hypothetical protein